MLEYILVEQLIEKIRLFNGRVSQDILFLVELDCKKILYG